LSSEKPLKAGVSDRLAAMSPVTLGSESKFGWRPEGLGLFFHPLAMENKSTSTWFALRNPVFCRLWLASVLSGTFVSAQDVTATWLMHDLGASSFSLSLMAAAASAPFFLFTLPAGAVADIVNRRAMIVGAVLWQGACSVLLAFGAWTDVISPSAVLACIFALGIGLAFSAPVWGAIVPDIVSKEELPSAVTLGGVQLNLSGIVGPALGGLLLPLLGAPLLISINAMTFLAVALVILQWRPRETPSTRLRENFTESFISSLRYARNSKRMKTILFRNLLFSVVISVIPALLPVIALKELSSSAAQLGLIFACVGVGSLGGAVFALPYLRQRISPNTIISIAMAIMVFALLSMALIRQVPALMASATLAGVAWALAGSELWATFRRNGAFQCRLDESLDQRGLFRLEYMVSTWAEHLRQNMRMTVDETRVFKKAWNLHAGDSEPIVRHFLSTQKFIHLPGFGFSGRTFTNTSRMPKPRLVAVTSDA
jgi:MFS family permease